MTITLLVIDDSEDDQSLYQRAFKDFNGSFSLVMASSAEAGFARIVEARPDLILLDYNLPDMDGLSFMKRLAANSDTPIPIVMLTGEGNTAMAVEVMKHGADDYLVKDTEGGYLRLLPGVVGRVMAAYAQREEIRRLRQEAEYKFRLLFESASDCLMLLSTNGLILDINHIGHERLGYTKEEMLGRHIAEFDSPEFAVRVPERVAKIMREGQLTFESSHVRKDGSRMPVEINCRSVELNGEKVLYSIIRDITERKKAEAALLKGEANLRSMLDNSPYLSWLKDLEGHYIAANKVFADYLRLEDADQIIGKTDLDLWPTELAQKYRADDAEVMAARQQKHLEELVLDGGNLLWVETFKAPIVDALGNVMGTVGIARDITERKKAEEELRLANETGRKRADELAQQFGYLLQSSFNEIYLFDANSMRFILTSEGAEKNLGYSDEELNQLTPLDLKPSYTRESFEDLIAPLRRGEQQALLFDTLHRRKDGTTYPVEVRLQLMEAESPVFLAIVQDITERQEAEQNKRKLTRALKLLSECGTLMIHAKNEQLLLEETCLLAVVTGGYLMAWVGIAENDADKTVRPIAQSGYEEGYLSNIKVTWSDTELGQGPTGTAIRTRATVVCQNCLTNPRMAPWRKPLAKRGYQSSIGLPLVSKNQILGALTIYSSDPLAFNDEEVVLLEELANNVAFGIETLRTREAQERAEQESHELSRHLQTVREEEKASFAREIHDELGGTLAALKMDAYWLAGKLAAEKKMEPLLQCAKSMTGLLDTAVLATRRIITDLRPTLLDDLGLMEALKWQSAQFQKRTGIECRFACAGGEDCEDRLDKVQSINLFRIFQETLTNVARHSGATRVKVDLRHDDKEAALTISDNGRGLPNGHTIASTSYGLRGMRERVAQLSGKIKIDAPPGGGFSVKVILPLPVGNEQQKGTEP